MDKKEDLEKKFLNIKKEIESYEAKDLLYTLANNKNNIQESSSKITSIFNWIFTIMIVVWSSPLILLYLIIILIKYLVKSIKSKFGNKL